MGRPASFCSAPHAGLVGFVLAVFIADGASLAVRWTVAASALAPGESEAPLHTPRRIF
jgi:hypothetical protein